MTDTDKTPAPSAPAPSGKRRGLALPPRGQALTRLQDLEAEAPSAPVALDAVNTATHTASSDAVDTDLSTATGAKADAAPPADAVAMDGHGTAANGPAPSLAARPAREPTTRITVDMPDSLHRRLSYLSVETRRSMKDLVIAALDATYFRPGAGDREAGGGR